MSVLRVHADRAVGTFTAPPSKSAAHRALIAAALSGNSCVHGVIPSADMEATLRCLQALGKRGVLSGETVTFLNDDAAVSAVADCAESGSTLRFMVPLFAALGREVTFVGHGRLPMRPMTVYEDCLPSHGVCLEKPSEDGAILHIKGQLRGGRFALPGDVSSQFITGLLMALPLCAEDSEIVLTSPLQSKGYVDMTLSVLDSAGIEVVVTDTGYTVRGGQRYALFEHTVEGDWSQAAFLLTAGAVGGDITVTGLRADSLQGDRQIEALLCEMGAAITWEGENLHVRQSALRAIKADVGDIPDLVPILSVAACAATGTTTFYNAARLRLKESDRLQTSAAMIRALGGDVTEEADALIVTGTPLVSGTVDGANDHRIVMSGAVASLLVNGEVTLTDAHSVSKSWPLFFDVFKQWGGVL